MENYINNGVKDFEAFAKKIDSLKTLKKKLEYYNTYYKKPVG